MQVDSVPGLRLFAWAHSPSVGKVAVICTGTYFVIRGHWRCLMCGHYCVNEPENKRCCLVVPDFFLYCGRWHKLVRERRCECGVLRYELRSSDVSCGVYIHVNDVLLNAVITVENEAEMRSLFILQELRSAHL